MFEYLIPVTIHSFPDIFRKKRKVKYGIPIYVKKYYSFVFIDMQS